MEFQGPKFLHSLKLAVLLVILQTFPTTLSQEVTSWTFNIPGISFLSFTPLYTNTQNQRISLSFRTRNPNSLIFCHYLKDLDIKELQRLNYRLCAELQYGLFFLSYKLLDYDEVRLSVGKALNNDQWHSLNVLLNSDTGDLTLTVDKETKVISLKPYTQYDDFSQLLDWSQYKSAIYFGGTDPNTLFSDSYPHFIGCLRDIKYTNKDEKHVSVPIETLEGVQEGCIDKCTNNPCHHGGQCINTYSETICDCFSTDYQGPYCSELGPSTVTLRGYEWLTYNLHWYDQNILSEKMRLSLEFKTSRGSGVLFYAAGGTPYHSHVTSSVHAGTVQVSVGLGDEDIQVEAGIGINDYRWHNLTIVHNMRKVYVYLDGQEHVRDILGPFYHLALHPKIFIGGGDDFVVTRGLQVTQNFVGCLKNVYINEVSVLHQMVENNPAVVYQGGGSMQPEYTCTEVVNIPISFPTSASKLRITKTEEMSTNFEIEFDFKSVRKEAVLVYMDMEDKDYTTGYHFGFIEVWLHQGQPNLRFVGSMTSEDRSQNLSLPNIVNDNKWHSLQLSFKDGAAKLKVDGNSVTSRNFRRPLEIGANIIVGYGYNKYKDSEGFVGCIRTLKVQGQGQDALDLIQTRAASGLIIDGCNITDYCKGNRMCKHGGICLSEWKGVACDCTETFYTGRACHFAKYKGSCDEYFQSGVNESGVMLIDLDGSGSMDPVYAECIMGFEKNYDFFGKTVVEHNFQPNTTVRGKMMRDMKKYIEYREMKREHLMRLVTESAWCEQHIRYDCQYSPLRLGIDTWFTAANGEMVEYLGTNNPGHCSCSLTNNCAGADRCNCDNKTMIVQFDEGTNTVRRQLPIIEMTIKQDDDPLTPGTGNMTLGPLICWGNTNQLPSKAVTFASGTGYLLSQAWRSGDIRVSFRTHHDTAIILYQAGTEDNINYFFVAVTSEYTVKFYFRWGLKMLDIDITSQEPVSNGEWHQVSIDTDQYNVRCMLDMNEKILDIPEDVPKVTLFSGILYIGGVPESFERDEILADVQGIVGCMRGLYYNYKAYALTDLIDSTTVDVSEECMASCWPNPCKNGAKCVEKWSSYQCICVNDWAHSGPNCDKDINMDAVTFLGRPESYLYFTQAIYSQLLDSTIIFSFRTFMKNCLLLYIHDHLNNFLQVELSEGKKVIAKFNRYSAVLSQTRTMTENLDDGEWNQIVIDNADGYIKVIVDEDNEPSRNSYKKLSLQTYQQNPFSEEEMVKPDRPAEQPPEGIHVYVGGVPGDMSTYPTINGCIRGLKIGETMFELQEAALKNITVSPLCEDGCETAPCHHGGICEERWQNKQFECDCTFSEYAGPTCNTEASGYFQGDSILQYKYDPPKAAIETRTERLELIFQVPEGTTEKMLLVFIFSERYLTHDFIVVYLDPKNGVYLSTNHGYSIHGVGKPGKFANGRPHQLLFKRNKSEMILTVREESHPKYRNNTVSVDEESIGRVTVPDNALDELDTIMIGGILDVQFNEIKDTNDYRNYRNFSGCMSEVTFYPVSDLPFSLRPLKDLRDNKNSTGIATVFGPEVVGCSTRDQMASTTTTTQVPTKPIIDSKKLTMPPWDPALAAKATLISLHKHYKFQLTMPPWDPAPAETQFIGPAPTLPQNKTTPLVTKQTTPSTSKAMEKEIVFESREKKYQDEIIAIALSVIAFLLIVAILIAIILVRMRNREKKKELEQKKKEEIEMKEHFEEKDDHVIENHQNQNYLARLDEFSMVSATLGSKPVKTDGMSTFKPPPSDSSYTYTSVPQSEDEGLTYPDQRFYNRKKNRPASSISEVLELMERNKVSKDDIEDFENLGNGPTHPITLEKSPITCHEDDEDNDADNESESPSPPPPLHHISEYNGDSGYEAESKPDEEQETLLKDICPGTESDGSYHSEDVAPSVSKSYKGDNSPPSPFSKNSTYMSDTNSPLSHSDNVSSGNTSPSIKNDPNIVNYGFPNSPVIEIGPEVIQQKPSILTNGGDNT
ncbi:axotactin-like isoform X2 [Ruditapes philippinarum]|uniref:axotactin-like isoform X2 n=1 Tax=Ruditapes philippinarum TaxID=129788 RepID=UPI00295B3244|nr:axotactin-like isoform X2 [Ruditapes philippinarum]